MATGLEQLSPFQLKDELIRYAKDFTQSKAATHALLNAGRGNPNWISTTPRQAFFALGTFAIEESRRVWNEHDLGGMPHADGIADRLTSFLAGCADKEGAALLRDAVGYAVDELGFDADALVHELVDGIIGDNYPEPDRMLVHCEWIVREFIHKVMFDEQPPPGTLDLFAVEGGTAAICYIFGSLVHNYILRPGDTIAIGAPIFTPYVELPGMSDFGLKTVDIQQSEMEGDRHTWQYPDEEIEKLRDPKIKAFFIVNPSNPASFAMSAETQAKLVELVRTDRPDLLIITDDVYGTFVDGFRSLAADLPQNTLLVYSFSKHFGCTGWRLGVIGLNAENVIDHRIAAHPTWARTLLHERYATLSTHPDDLKFIDRIVADSRDVALNHTAGLSTPQQIQMALFSLFTLIDTDDAYTKRCRAIVHGRFARLLHGLGLALPDDPLRVGYYATFDLEAWGRHVIGKDFTDYVKAHDEPIDIVIGLAKHHGTVLLDGGGFGGPPWSVRVSLANLDDEDYEKIGRDLKDIVTAAVARWRATQAKH